jgi:hypothetical protein
VASASANGSASAKGSAAAKGSADVPAISQPTAAHAER